MTGMKNFSHEPQPVYESINNELLWDFKMQTDNKIEHNKPDIVVMDEIERKYLIIDVACPFDIRVKYKEKEKIENYQDLKRELKRIWKLRRVTVVPIITGALGTVSKDIEKWLAEFGVTCRLESLQRAFLLGTARILRKVRGHLRSRAITWCLRKTLTSHPEVVFNEENNNYVLLIGHKSTSEYGQ